MCVVVYGYLVLHRVPGFDVGIGECFFLLFAG